MKKKNKIKIKLNGKTKLIEDKTKIETLIKYYKIPIKKVAIELNRIILDKKKLKNVKLRNNDQIEIVHFIGGG